MRHVRVEARIYRGNRIRDVVTKEATGPDEHFAPILEKCLIAICHELDMPIPLWMRRNTREFARYHQTVFTREQYLEPVSFDRFQLKLLNDTVTTVTDGEPRDPSA